MYELPEGVQLKMIEHVGRFTIAQVTDGRRRAVGLSRCSFLDRFNESRGNQIAVGRAVEALEKKKNHKLIHNSFMG